MTGIVNLICFLLFFVVSSIVWAQETEFRCAFVRRNMSNIASFFFERYSELPHETEVCHGVKICRSTWVQDGARVVILRQGCAKSVVGVQDPYSQLCRTTTCVPYYIHHPDTNFCPIGPQASCCCNEPMCNMNVKPYNRPCRVPPLPKNNTIKYGRPVKSSSNFTTLLFIVLGCVAVGALCFWGCLFGLVMGSSRCISISCPNLKLNKDRTTTTPNITTNAPLKTEIV